MLDEQKVRLMTELAMYEQNQGKEDLKIDEYYRNDYVGFHSVCSLIWITVGYVCVAGLCMFASLDSIIENLSKSMILKLVLMFCAGYMGIIVVYGLITYYLYSRRHKNAKKRLKIYENNLKKLLKLYEKEKR